MTTARHGPDATARTDTLIDALQQIVNARKVLEAVGANARKSHQSMATVRVLHGVLDAETARLASTL
jgi:hypothetical protein